MKKIFTLTLIASLSGMLLISSPAISQTPNDGGAVNTTADDMDDDDGTDWGWLGLLGLIGLYGLKGKDNRDRHTSTTTNR